MNFCSIDLGLDASKTTLSDYILKSVLELISKDSTDSNKYLAQYFQLFVMYVGYGVPEVCNFILGIPVISKPLKHEIPFAPKVAVFRF